MRVHQPSSEDALAAWQARLAVLAPGGDLSVTRKAAALGHFIDYWPDSILPHRVRSPGMLAFRCASLAELAFIDTAMREPDYACFDDLKVLWACYAAELRNVRKRPDNVDTIPVLADLAKHIDSRLALADDDSDARLDATMADLKRSVERLLTGAKEAFEALNKVSRVKTGKPVSGQSLTPVALTMRPEFRDAMASLELAEGFDDETGRTAQAFGAPLLHAAKRAEALVETRTLVLTDDIQLHWPLRGLGHHMREAAYQLRKRALLLC